MAKPSDKVLVARNSPHIQGEGEAIPYQFEFEGATTAVHVSTKVYDDKWEDVTSDVTTGSASESGNVVTTETIQNLRPGKQYRIIITATVDTSQTRVAAGDIICKDPKRA